MRRVSHSSPVFVSFISQVCVFVAALIACVPFYVSAQESNAHITEWASRVISFSSQRSTPQYSAQQVLGKPNVCPAGGDNPCAWAAEFDAGNDGGAERIRVEFSKAIHVRQVAIAENLNPGAIEQVLLYEPNGTMHALPALVPHVAGVPSRMNNIILPVTPFEVNSVELLMQCGKVAGTNEIDAIAISTDSTPVRATINVPPNLPAIKRENLGSNINSAFDEVLPVIAPDGKTLFIDRKNYPTNTGHYDNIWFSKQGPDGKWQPAQNIGSPLNNNYGSFVVAVSPDGNSLYLGGTFIRNGSNVFGLWKSELTANGWGYPTHLEIRNFFSRSVYVEFSLGVDGKTMILSLDRPNGAGGKDLYVSFLQQDNTWSEPRSLGPTINSASDEAMPFLAADGKTLYFASLGFSGYGGYDMYITRRQDSTWEHWSEPQNLGSGFNTSGGDGYYTIPAAGDYAYFVSTTGSVGQGDAFRAALPKALRPEVTFLVTGKVLDSKTRKPVAATIKYEVLPKGKEVGTASSNPVTGEYSIILPAGAVYGFRAESKGYLSQNDNMRVDTNALFQEVHRDLILVPIEAGETLRINNIFFEFNKFDLKPESGPELDRLADALRTNASIGLSIAGYTDNVGSAAKNKELSQRRANAVRDYLIAKGIPAKKIKAVGMGDASPVANNTTEEGRQQNRRVQVTILNN